MKKFFRMITNKWLLKGTTTVILVALVIACYIALNWGIEQLKIEDLDFTTKKLYSLSEESKKRLEQLDGEITIQLINIRDYMSHYVDGNYVIDYIQKYENASDKVKIEEINDLSTRVDLQTKYEITSSDILVVIKYGETEETIYESDLYTIDYTTYELIDKTEEAITNAITKLTVEDKPNIYALTGGKTYYTPEQVLSVILYQLNDEANNVQQLDILVTGSVPDDCDCLIMTTLKEDLSELERDKILEYINKGGKILMLSSQNIINVETPNFDRILDQYGITMEYGVIFEQNSSKMLSNSPELILADVNASFMSDIDMGLTMFLVDAGKIEFAATEKLEELGVTYEAIATTSEKSFIRTKLDLTSSSRTNEDSEEGSSIVGAYVNKKIDDNKTSELIIYSNEIMATNLTIPVNMQYAVYPILERNNEDIILNSISHLTKREDTITIRKTYEAEGYTVTDQQDVIIKTIIFTVPVMIIVIGIAVWIYRRRKV